MIPYAPREGTKQAEACLAIEKAKGLSCEPLSRILGCTLHEVPGFLKTVIEKGYIVKERREGVLFFVRGEGSRPVKRTNRPEVTAEVATLVVRPVPEVLPEPEPVGFKDLGPGFSEPVPASTIVDWHAYEKGEQPVPAPKQVATPERDSGPTAREFACAFTSEREFGLCIGGQRFDLSTDEASTLWRMLNGMHVAGLLA